MLKIIGIFLSIAFIEISLYIICFHNGILTNMLNLVVYKEYLNEWLVLSLLFILFYKRIFLIDILLYLLVAIVLIVDIIQFLSYFYTGAFLTIDALDNISQILLFINDITLLTIGLFIIIYLGLIYYINKIEINKRRESFYIIFIITLFNFLIYAKYRHKNDIFDKFSVEKGPIKQLCKVVIKYMTPINHIEITLNKNDINFIKKYKLINNLNSSYPFLHNYFYNKKLKYNNLTIKPNIIVFFVESLSAKYVDIYNNKDKNITPNIDKLAKKGFYVKNYINHTFPTIRGIYGQLCSLYPEFRVKDIVDNYNSYYFYNKKCLPSYLNEYGYYTIYFNHGNKKRQEIGRLSKSYGFQKTFFNIEISKMINENPQYHMDDDMSDQQMSKVIIKYLKNYNNKKPFFIVVSTIETHVGMKLSKDSIKRQDLDTKYNTYYNMDNALGKIFTYINNSKYKNNTIIIVTGDHVRMGRHKKYHSKIYDQLSLIIYSPFFKYHVFNANTSSIDFAPTVLHLINYPNKKNSFQGKSIFEDNSNIAIGVTRDYGSFYAIFNKDGSLSKSTQFEIPIDKTSEYVNHFFNYTFMIYDQNRLYK